MVYSQTDSPCRGQNTGQELPDSLLRDNRVRPNSCTSRDERRGQDEPMIFDFQVRTKDLEQQSCDKQRPKESAAPQAQQPQSTLVHASPCGAWEDEHLRLCGIIS
jgi:hypothetical protein